MMVNRLFFLFAACLIFAACEETKFISATRATTVSDSIYATVLETMPNEIAGERLLSTSTNEDIAEFEERISNFDVDSLIFSISEYSGEQGIELQQNQLLLLDLERIELLPPLTVPDVDLYDYSANELQYVMRFNDTESRIIADRFLEDKGVYVQFRSFITGKPVAFRVKATMYMKVTGEIL